MSKHQRIKFKVLDEVFADWYSNFDPDIADLYQIQVSKWAKLVSKIVWI